MQSIPETPVQDSRTVDSRNATVGYAKEAECAGEFIDGSPGSGKFRQQHFGLIEPSIKATIAEAVT